MSNFARVVNSVAVDISSDPAANVHPIVAAEFISVPDEVSVGWLLVDGDWKEPGPQPTPSPSVPSEVTNAQAREALIRSNISIASVGALIQEITDPVEREIAYTQWEYRNIIPRSAQLVESLTEGMCMTTEQVDDLFRLAATL